MREEISAIHIAPWMHVIMPGGGVPLDELLPSSGSVYVARLNGQKMPDEVSTFQHFSEVLKFPEHFGWNWNAFYDCVRDLNWLSADNRILIIESAERILSQDGDSRKKFFGCLWRAGQRWSYTKRPEGVTLTKLSVVLSCDKDRVSTLAKQLEEWQEQHNW
ncbi:barstar family protein [Streptomyces avidinii]|uniref:barstar family protein n=1 Tax=Streptomyces avidinii TaxID=1895 RepID=UPI0038654D2E|nr:barstar family protein [Streptomyces avidinii]